MDYIKYPKTPHFPWSLGIKSDDTTIDIGLVNDWKGKRIVVTEKMDGENTTMYSNYIHARSLDSKDHPSRSRVKAIHGRVKFLIPEGWRVCGENVSAVHSIRYEDLISHFMVFSVWNDENVCLDRGDMVDFCNDIGLNTVPVLFDGMWENFHNLVKRNEVPRVGQPDCEGYVVQPYDSYHFNDFRENVAKFVRKDHVQTDEHWMNKSVEWNGIKQ